MPVRTSSARTMESWARPVREETDLPASFRDPYREWRRKGAGLAVLGPAENEAGFRRTAFLLLRRPGETRLVEQPDSGGSVPLETALPDPQLAVLETGRVLLDSWIVIRGTDRRLFLRYNSVVDRIFQPLLDQIMHSWGSAPDSDVRTAAHESLAALRRADFRYSNYARAHLRPAAPLQWWLHQPCFSVPGSSRRAPSAPRFPSRLLLLTAAELLIIEADPVAQVPYGHVCRTIPRTAIAGVTVERIPGDPLRLTVRLRGGEELTLAHAPTMDNEEALWELRYLLPGA